MLTRYMLVLFLRPPTEEKVSACEDQASSSSEDLVDHRTHQAHSSRPQGGAVFCCRPQEGAVFCCHPQGGAVKNIHSDLHH